MFVERMLTFREMFQPIHPRISLHEVKIQVLHSTKA
jgi:hypothetical protein